MRLPASYSFFQARGRDGSHYARPVTSLAATAVHATFGRRIRKCQQIQDRAILDDAATRAAGLGVLSGLAGRGCAGYVSWIHTFSGEASRDGRGACSVCSRRVWRGHPRVAYWRGQGLGAALVRPGARRQYEAYWPRPVDGDPVVGWKGPQPGASCGVRQGAPAARLAPFPPCSAGALPT